MNFTVTCTELGCELGQIVFKRGAKPGTVELVATGRHILGTMTFQRSELYSSQVFEGRMAGWLERQPAAREHMKLDDIAVLRLAAMEISDGHMPKDDGTREVAHGSDPPTEQHAEPAA